MRTLGGELVGFSGRPTQTNDFSSFLNRCFRNEPRLVTPVFIDNIGVTPRPMVPTAKELRCVEAAQVSYPIHRFVHCKSATDTIRSGKNFKLAPRPCLSENYVRVSTILLKTVAHCGGLEARELFGLWNHESGLHMNMVSHTGAVSATQLTSGAVDFIRDLDFKEGEFNDPYMSEAHMNIARNAVRGLSNRLRIDPQCSNLATLARYSPVDSSQSCELLSEPVMPTAAYIIGAKNYLVGRKIFEDVVPRFTSGTVHASEKSQNEIVFALSQYAYNGGIAGMMRLFKTFFLLNSFKAEINGKLQSVRPRSLSTSQMLTVFSQYIRQHYGSSETTAERRSEVATYLSDPNRNNGVREMLAQTEKSVGSRCF